MNITKRCIVLFISLMLLSLSSNASAAAFWKTGKITRTLTETGFYGGCMIKLSTSIANGCPNNGWVSLDCEGKFSDPGEGNRAYASALVALALDKKVSVYVEDTKRVTNNYCVARRLDIRP